MAQQRTKQNRPKQPQDPYAQKGKQLTSAVQRLRGWVGSDPSRTPELADALVALTEHRLLGHAHTVAAPEAQESVKLAAQLLTANGPIGPYTAVTDAARYVTAVVHLGAVQSAAGLVEAGAETVGSLSELREELGSLPLVEALAPTTVIWALSCTARGALAGDDLPEANAYVDAALQRLAESGLRSDPEAAYLVIDTDRLTSDARWAAARSDDALTHLHLARDTYDAVVDGRLAQPGRLGPALVQRLAEPLFGLYRDLADRLLGVGEVDLGLQTRRQLVELLRGLATKDETARVELVASLADLVQDLREQGRSDEAELVADELDARPAADRAAAADLPPGPARGSGPVRWEPLNGFAAYAGGRATAAPAVAAIEEQLQRQTAARLAAEREEAHRLEQQRHDEARQATEQREAERAEAERRGAERADAERAEAARREFERIEAERLATERLAAEEEAERQERKRRREERIEAHRLEQEQREAARLEAEQLALEQREAERRAADPAEIERLELERLQAEIAELERAEQEAERRRLAEEEATRFEVERLAVERMEEERLAAERLAVERSEAERVAAEQEAAEQERAERERAEQVQVQPAEPQVVEQMSAESQPVELIPAEPAPTQPPPVVPEPEPAPAAPEPEPAEVPAAAPPAEVEDEHIEIDDEPEDELAGVQRSWQEARTRGDRKAARALNEQLVDALRSRTEQELAEYGPRLLYALEELSSARLRGGDLWGSRTAAREAKALAKALGRR